MRFGEEREFKKTQSQPSSPNPRGPEFDSECTATSDIKGMKKVLHRLYPLPQLSLGSNPIDFPQVIRPRSFITCQESANVRDLRADLRVDNKWSKQCGLLWFTSCRLAHHRADRIPIGADHEMGGITGF
jgi:hypothetical protein